jgi:hypothetical protein
MQNVHQMETTSMLTLAVFEKDRIVGTREYRKRSVTIKPTMLSVIMLTAA